MSTTRSDTVARLHIYDLVRKNVTCFYTTAQGKKQAIKGMRKVKMPIKYVSVSAGEPGLLEKSLTAVKGAQTQGIKNILLFTEDAHLIAPPMISDPPKDYDVLYFGGAIQGSVTHYSETWKSGVFLDANFVIIRDTAYKKIVNNAKKGTKSFSELLADLSAKGKLKTYCLNPQIVSTYSAERESQTNLYNLQESVTGYPVVECPSAESPDPPEPPETQKHNVLLVTIQQKDFPVSGFDCLVYSYLRDTLPKEQVRWVIAVNNVRQDCLGLCKNLPNVSIVELPTGKTFAEAFNYVLKDADFSDDTRIVNYPCGMYFKSRYLSTIALATDYQVLSTTETYVYVIQDGSVRKYSPVDVNGNKNVLSSGTIAFTGRFYRERHFVNSKNVFQQFISGRTSQVRVLPEVLSLKIVGDTDSKLELTDTPITAFYESERDQTFLECVYHTF